MMTILFPFVSDLGEYEQLVWNLRFVSAFLGSLVVPIVYQVLLLTVSMINFYKIPVIRIVFTLLLVNVAVFR